MLTAQDPILEELHQRLGAYKDALARYRSVDKACREAELLADGLRVEREREREKMHEARMAVLRAADVSADATGEEHA